MLNMLMGNKTGRWFVRM